MLLLLFIVTIGAALVLGALRPSVAFAQTPTIELTSTPAFGSYDDLVGRVHDADPRTHAIAVAIYVGRGWWTKPTWDERTVDLDDEGRFTVDVTTGGIDEQATRIAVFLVPAGYLPPRLAGHSEIPSSLRDAAVASEEVVREPVVRTIQFSNETWSVKASRRPVGPGPNLFSDSEENVWVDDHGRLHLKITRRDERWYVPEVILTRSLGHGTYRLDLESSVDGLDRNVVFGWFTWDDDPAHAHREIDGVEFIRWGDATSAYNANYVVQPYEIPNRQHKFLARLGASSSHTFDWQADRVRFESRDEHGDLAASWEFQGAVPPPGQESVRMNLWLFGGAPPADQDQQEVEIVVGRFEFRPPAPISTPR